MGIGKRRRDEELNAGEKERGRKEEREEGHGEEERRGERGREREKTLCVNISERDTAVFVLEWTERIVQNTEGNLMTFSLYTGETRK